MGVLLSNGGMQCNSNRFEVLDTERPPSKQKKRKSSAAEVMVKIGEHWQTLYEAAAKNAAEFKKVLEQVSNETQQEQTEILNFVGPSEDTLIHVAARHGNADIVELIVKKVPCLLNKKGFNDDTVWHIAAKTGKIIEQLFKLHDKFKVSLQGYSHGKKSVEETVTWEDLCLKGTNEEGNTALHEAIINSRICMADLLVGHDLDLSLYINKEKKSALYLAAEAGYEDTVKNMLEKATEASKKRQEDGKFKLKGKSIVHAAILGKNIAVLALILDSEVKFIETIEEDQGEKELRLIETKDEEGMNPLHWAASIGFLEGVKYLLLDKKISMFKDKKKLHPIHWASMNGHVEVVKALLPHHDNLNNLVTRDGHNVLHLAAKHGRHNVVSYILDTDKTPELAYLLNKGDAQQNTPLHLATVHWHPKIVNALTWDDRVDLKLSNEDGLTALDAALLNIKGIGSFRQWLTWQVLLAAGVPQATSDKVLNAKRTASMKSKPTNTVNYFIIVRALFFASIAVGLVSYETRSSNFAYDNNFDTYIMGITTSVPHIKSYIFAFCNYVSMFTSIGIMFTSIGIMFALIWANFGDTNRVFNTLRYAVLTTVMALIVVFAMLFYPVCLPLPTTSGNRILRHITYFPICLMIGMAVTMLSLELMPGVYPVGRKYPWLVDAVLTTVMALIVVFAMLFYPVCLPLPTTSGNRILRHITYFPIRLMIVHICDHLDEWFSLMS